MTSPLGQIVDPIPCASFTLLFSSRISILYKVLRFLALPHSPRISLSNNPLSNILYLTLSLTFPWPDSPSSELVTGPRSFFLAAAFLSDSCLRGRPLSLLCWSRYSWVHFLPICFRTFNHKSTIGGPTSPAYVRPDLL